jgi:hypothetical protein
MWVVSFTPRPLYPWGKAPITYWIGGCVGPWGSLDDVGKRKFSTLSGLEIQPLCLPVRSQSLYRLSYPVCQTTGSGSCWILCLLHSFQNHVLALSLIIRLYIASVLGRALLNIIWIMLVFIADFQWVCYERVMNISEPRETVRGKSNLW